MTLLLALCLMQNDDAAKLVERLRSDSVEERDEAARNLKDQGKEALPALEKAAKDPDREVAARAILIHRVIRNREYLPEALRKKVPGLEDRLAGNNPHLWTEVFLAVTGYEEGPVPKLEIEPRLLGPMVALAMRGASDDDDRDQVAFVVNREYIPVTAAQVLPLLREPGPCAWAALMLAQLQAQESLPEILTVVREGKEPMKSRAVDVLFWFRVKEGVPFVIPRLKDPSSAVRAMSARWLGEVGDRSAVQALVPLLTDESVAVAGSAGLSLAQLGSKEHLPALVRQLREGDANLKWYAVQALGLLGFAGHGGEIASLLQHSDVQLRWAAIEALGRMGYRDCLPELRKLLDAPLPKTRELAREAIRRIEEKK